MAGSLLGGGSSHKSNVTGIGAALDPMNYFHNAIGLKAINPHTYSQDFTTALNSGLSTITKPLIKLDNTITPGKKWLMNEVPLIKSWEETKANRPVDALGIAAAIYFGGGALAGAGGAGAGGAGLGTAGNAAASSAITPTFASGATGATAGTTAGAGLGAAGQAYGSAMLGGASAAGANAAAAGAGGGIGGLGVAGTAAGTTALTPALTNLGTGQSFFGQLISNGKDYWNDFNTARKYYNQGKSIYDAMNQQQAQQQPMQLVNPYKKDNNPNRFYRGY